MKKILLLIFIAMPCLAYSGSFVRHGYLFHYDDTVKANGSFQTAVSIYAGDDLTQWNESLITMSGDYYKYLTMYFSKIHELKAREYKVGEYLLVRGKFLTKEEASAIFGIPMHLVLEQYLYTSHKITSKFSLNDADGDCVPDFLDPTPNMPNTIFQLAKDFDCSGKLYKYTIMVDSEDGTQLNIGEPKEYVVNNSPDTNCSDPGAYAPIPVTSEELLLTVLCLQCTGDGFVALDCSGGGNGTDPGDNGTDPEDNGTDPDGGSGGGSGGSNSTNPDSGGSNNTDTGGGGSGDWIDPGGGGSGGGSGGDSGGDSGGGSGDWTDPGGGGSGSGGTGGDGNGTSGSGTNGTADGNGTIHGGGGGGGSGGNGTDWGNAPDHEFKIANSTLFDVEEERQRAEKAKEEFLKAWDDLKRKVGSSFSINMDSSERLPKWRWNIFGKIVVIDLNIYRDDLKYIGIMLILICFVIALFVVFGD